MKRRYSFRGLIVGFLLGTIVTAGVMTFVNNRGQKNSKPEMENEAGKKTEEKPSIQITVSEQKDTDKKKSENKTKALDPSKLKCFPKAFSADGNVELKEFPSQSSKTVATIASFECLNRIGESSDWVNVKVDETGATGYIHKSLIINDERQYIMTHKVNSKDGFANVRAGASKDSKALIALSTGTEIVVFPGFEKGSWLYAGYRGAQKFEYGYIHKSIVQKK